MNGKESQLPAVDSQELHKEQMECFVGGIEELGNYAKDIKHSTKINNYLSIAWIAIFFLVIIIAFWKGGGLDGLLDTAASVRSFNCTGSVQDNVRTYTDAKTFIDMFGGECVLLKKGVAQ